MSASTLSLRRAEAGRSRALLIACAVVLAALVARTIELERKPLHFDEGINVTLGHRPPAEVLSISRATYDNDPPGHRFALGIWMALAGPSPFAIRIFSVLMGALAVAAVYRLSRDLGLAPAPSLLAAGLMAASPYAIEYSQQAKGYAMGAGLAAASWLLWMRWMLGGRPPAHPRLFLTAYAVATALALSTHYYVIPLLAMQWFWFAGVRLSARRAAGAALPHRSVAGAAPPRPRVLRAAAAQAAACLPVATWIGLMADSLVVSTARSSTKFQPPALQDALTRILGEMSISQSAPAELMATAGATMAVLAVLGAIALWRRGGPGRAAFWFGASFVLLLAGTLALQQRVTFFFPRFLLYALPHLCVCLAALALVRPPFGSLAAVAPAAWLIGALAVTRAPVDAQNDYRALVGMLRPLIRPGDAALGTYLWMEGMFSSYAPETRGALHWHPDYFSPGDVDSLLSPIASAHPRVWALSFERNPDDPGNLASAWLKRHAALAGRFEHGTTSVLAFDTADEPAPGQDDAPEARATFDGRIRLDYAPLAATAGLGDSVPFRLTWSSTSAISDSLAVFVHLLAPDGSLAAQNDGDPVNGLAPMSGWPADARVEDRRALLIREPLPAGEYTLLVGVYRRSDNARLTTESGSDAARIGIVTIAE